MAELIRRAGAGFLSVVDGVALFLGFSLREPAGIGHTLVQSGQPIDSAGRAPQNVGDLPLVGPWPEQPGSQVRATAADIIPRGPETSAYGRRLGLRPSRSGSAVNDADPRSPDAAAEGEA